MQLSDFLTAVRTRLGNPSTDGFFSDANLTDILNEALHAVSTDVDWPWLQTSTSFNTTGGTATYTPTAGWNRTRVLCIDGYDPLEERSLAEIRSYPSTERGRPEWYAISGDTIILRPVPDGTYAVIHDYIKNETSMSAPSSEVLMPTVYQYSIVAKAVELAHLRQSRPDRAREAAEEYLAWIERMKDNRRRTSAPKRIRVRPGSAF